MKNFKYLVIPFLFLLSCQPVQKVEPENFKRTELDCISDPSTSQITNGRGVASADPLSKDAVLIIIRRDQKISSCTGVAVAENLILTAAHCVQNANSEDVNVIFDTSMLCSSGYTPDKAISAKSILIHDDFDGNPKSNADLALIQLSKNIANDYTIAKLFDADLAKISSDMVVLIGYGITGEKNKDSMVLRGTQKSFSEDLYVKSPLLLVGQKNSTGGFCRGDSGAPIYVFSNGDKKIIGINSFNIDEGNGVECHTASAAMYIPYFESWITSATKVLR